MDDDHLAATGFAALALAFDVAGVFVSLTATRLARLHFRVSTSRRGEYRQTGNYNCKSENRGFEHIPLVFLIVFLCVLGRRCCQILRPMIERESRKEKGSKLSVRFQDRDSF